MFKNFNSFKNNAFFNHKSTNMLKKYELKWSKTMKFHNSMDLTYVYDFKGITQKQ